MIYAARIEFSPLCEDFKLKRGGAHDTENEILVSPTAPSFRRQMIELGWMAVFEFIEGWDNPYRRHSSIGYESPLSYEKKHAVHAAVSSAAGKKEAPVSADTRGGVTT